VVEALNPQRIGHGVLSFDRPDILNMIKERGVVLEICPTSNLRTKVFKSIPEMAGAARRLADAGVVLTVSTDGPVMMNTSLRDEHALLVSSGALSVEEVRAANHAAHENSFCPPGR
jgi:adenosine deaminase